MCRTRLLREQPDRNSFVRSFSTHGGSCGAAARSRLLRHMMDDDGGGGKLIFPEQGEGGGAALGFLLLSWGSLIAHQSYAGQPSSGTRHSRHAAELLWFPKGFVPNHLSGPFLSWPCVLPPRAFTVPGTWLLPCSAASSKGFDFWLTATAAVATITIFNSQL